MSTASKYHHCMEAEEVGRDMTARRQVGDMRRGQPGFVMETWIAVWVAKERA